jgi:hypothetical protein
MDQMETSEDVREVATWLTPQLYSILDVNGVTDAGTVLGADLGVLES